MITVATLSLATHLNRENMMDLTQLDAAGISKLTIILVGVQLLLRALAEALTRAAEKTAAKWDNKLAKTLALISWFLGVILGKFGYGIPDKVLKDELEKKTT